MAQTTFSRNSSYKLDVEAALVSQSGTKSKIYWRMLVIKTNNYGHTAWGNTGSNGFVESSLGAYSDHDLWSNNNMQYNFQNGSMNGTFTIAEGTFEVQHRVDGTAEYFVEGMLNLYNLGSAKVTTDWRSLPRIKTANVPEAPTSLGVDRATMDEVRYRWSGNGDGGSPILDYEIQWWTEKYGPWVENGMNGGVLTVSVPPATITSFRSRARNAIGFGPWSTTSSGSSLGGARIKIDGVWRQAIPYVKLDGVWRVAQPYVKVNGIWKKSV